MLLRENTLPNRRNIKKMYKQDFVKLCRVSNVDLVLIDSKKAIEYILNEAHYGRYMIKRNHFEKT